MRRRMVSRHQVLQKPLRRSTTQELKVFNHVHLIVIACFMSNAHPSAIWCAQLHIQSHLVTRNPCVDFGADADISDESPSYCNRVNRDERSKSPTDHFVSAQIYCKQSPGGAALGFLLLQLLRRASERP